jgi:hypothetical protein
VVESKSVSYIDFRPNTPCIAWPGWQQVLTRLEVEAYGTGQTVLFGAVHSHVLARPADQSWNF